MFRLQHRESDDAVFELARGHACPRYALELGPMLPQIAQGLLLCVEFRGKPAYLPICAGREKEDDGSVVWLDSRHDRHTPACDRNVRASPTASKATIAATSVNAS